MGDTALTLMHPLLFLYGKVILLVRSIFEVHHLGPHKSQPGYNVNVLF